MAMVYNRFFAFLLLSVSFIFNQNIKPIVYGAETLIDSKETHPTITLLYDFHVDHPDLTTTNCQRREIARVITTHKLGVVIEDSGTYEGNNEEVKKTLDERMRRGGNSSCPLKIKGEKDFSDSVCCSVMNCLMPELKDKTNAINAECRFLSMASYAHYAIPPLEVYNYYNTFCESLLKYKTDRAFHFYQPIITSFYNDNDDIVQFMLNTNKRCLGEFLFQGKRDCEKSLLLCDYRLQTYDLCFVDLMMLRAIDELKCYKHIVMVCGGNHCRNVSSCLTALGYTRANFQINEVETKNNTIEVDPINISNYFDNLKKV